MNNQETVISDGNKSSADLVSEDLKRVRSELGKIASAQAEAVFIQAIIGDKTTNPLLRIQMLNKARGCV